MNFATRVIMDPRQWAAWEGQGVHAGPGPHFTFADTSTMAQEAIRKAQWRKIASRLPAGVQDGRSWWNPNREGA